MFASLKVLVVMIVAIEVSPQSAGAQTAETISQLESGSWGWEDGKNTCELNPQQFEFSEDASSVTISWAHEHDLATYVIERMTPNGFVAEIVGEERLTDDGLPVRWQLVLLTSDAFCWHRMDWPLLTCTKSQVRCSLVQPSS